MTTHIQHVSLLAVAAWLPWLLLFQQKHWQARLANKRTAYWFLLICLSIGGQFLAGFPQLALLNISTFVMVGLLGPLLWFQAPDEAETKQVGIHLNRLVEALSVTVLPVIIGVGLAAVQLLPTAELIGLSVRGQDAGMGFFTSYSLGPPMLTQFLFPFWQLGMPSGDNLEFWGYLGALPILLAIAAPLVRRDARTWFFLLFALLCLSLALGGNTPFFQWLFNLPVFNRFRVPARFIFLFTFAAAFLAATGFEELQTRLRRVNWPPRSIVFGLVTILFGTPILAYGRSTEIWIDAWQWLPWVWVLLSMCAMVAASLKLIPQSIFTLFVIGLVAFDLTAFAVPFSSNLARTAPPTELTQVPRSVRAMDATTNGYRVLSSKFPAVSQAALRAVLWPELALAYGKQSVTAYVPLGIQRNAEYVQAMSPAMRNLINIRYYLLPLDTLPPGMPSPFDESEPDAGLTLDILNAYPSIQPTRANQIEITSYTDQTIDLPDDYIVGELDVSLGDGKSVTLPIRLGRETADWAYDGMASLGKVRHGKPEAALSFPAYLSSVGHEFQGYKYVARYVVSDRSALMVTALGVRSFVPEARLVIEHIALIDEVGNSTSLAKLLHRNDLALAFRSHTAAMWENKDVLPRAFMAHQVQVVPEDQVLMRLQETDFRPDQVVLLSDAQPLELDGTHQGTVKDEVMITEYKAERVAIKVKTDEAGYLVLTDTWYPGWVASVDGKTALIYRADYIFRAVALQPGDHTVVFEYKPVSFVWGAGISLFSLLVLGVMAIGFRLVVHRS